VWNEILDSGGRNLEFRRSNSEFRNIKPISIFVDRNVSIYANYQTILWIWHCHYNLFVMQRQRWAVHICIICNSIEKSIMNVLWSLRVFLFKNMYCSYDGQYVEGQHRLVFGAGTGPILLDNVVCTGHESSIFDCSHQPWGSHNCDHREDVNLICTR